MDQLKSEFYETITELNRKFIRKLKEHLNRIEQQEIQLHRQNGVIEELAWQIRDLRDSLRECNERVSRPSSREYCIECAKSRMKLNIPTANDTKQSDHVAGRGKIVVFTLSLCLALISILSTPSTIVIVCN